MYKTTAEFNVGQRYIDTTRSEYCQLVAITPYKYMKHKSYLDFKYLDGSYIRQKMEKAIGRFVESQLETENNTQVLDQPTDIDYSNVIRVDFINRQRIA